MHSSAEAERNCAFLSDNCSAAHPAVMEALQNANKGCVSAYGYDPYTLLAEKAFDEAFGRKVYAFLALSGTGANVSMLSHVTKRYGGVVCADSAHVFGVETGAPERAGLKLYPRNTHGGKLTPEHLEGMAEFMDAEHYALPQVICVTQPTEWGDVYTPDELRALSAFARSNGMLLVMDGARIATAAAALGAHVSELTYKAGVDAMVFGGTKNAMLFGEAVIFFDEALADCFKYTRKAVGQLSSKMRFIAAQFCAMLSDGLWLETAQTANEAAQKLYLGLLDAPGVELLKKPETNMVFARLCESAASRLGGYELHTQDGFHRFVTSFSTTRDEIEALVAAAKG